MPRDRGSCSRWWTFSPRTSRCLRGSSYSRWGCCAAQAQESPSADRASGAHRIFTWANLVRGGVVALAVWGVAVTGWLLASRDSGDGWDVVAGLEEIERLTNDADFTAAYDIARELDPQVGNDSVRTAMWEMVSRTLTVSSEPAGATVLRRDYAPIDAPWEELGTTPVTVERYPFGRSRVRLELKGRESIEVALVSGVLAEAGPFQMAPSGSMPEGMIPVQGGEAYLFVPGLEQLPALDIPDYFLGRLEVTNREYEEFVDGGGYDDPACWTHPFEDGGRTLSFEEAMDRFVDRTGRPGPSTWEAGTYPDGTADHPVGGVSWYEAEAYACFRGMSLPTVYHWYWEADPLRGAPAVPLSNFDGEGPAPVGSYGGMTRSGTLDMAGNVREWVRNTDGEGRFIIGGGSEDPRYAFNDAVTSPPFDRSAANGLRLALYPDSTGLEAASARIEPEFRDYTVEAPVSDEVFDVYRQLYDYDRTALNAELVSTDTTELWVRQRLDLDAAYEGPRLTLFVYVPADASGPVQPIMFFPGSGDIYQRDYANLSPGVFDFVIRSGRAFIYPAYLGTWERGTELSSDVQNTSAMYRDHVISWSKDFRRAVDYLATRDDMDMDAVGYLGISWGGAMGPIMVAMDERVRAAVFYVGGLMMQQVQPSADPFNFLPRVTAPTLLFNGRYDSFFPYEASIVPFAEHLGVSGEEKRVVVTDANHFVLSFNRNDSIREALDWFDRWLGEVN